MDGFFCSGDPGVQDDAVRVVDVSYVGVITWTED